MPAKVIFAYCKYLKKCYNYCRNLKNKKEKQAESKENILEEQVSKEPKVIGIKKK